MNYIDAFSGIGGFAYGAYLAGMKFDNHYFSEVDPWCVNLYQNRFPDAVPLGDIKNYREWRIEKSDSIITAGFPCQPFSNAGRRKFKDDDRYLWPQLFEVIKCAKPIFIILENVTQIDNGEPLSILEEIYNDLESIRFKTLPPLEIPAACFSPVHHRLRTWIIAYSEKVGRGDWWRFKEKALRSIVFKGLDEAGFRAKLSTGEFGRGDNGLPFRMDRLKGLGNSIVPQIAAVLFSAIKPYLMGE